MATEAAPKNDPKSWVQTVEIESWYAEPNGDAITEALDWRDSPLALFRPSDGMAPDEMALRDLVAAGGHRLHQDPENNFRELTNEQYVIPKGSGYFEERVRPDQLWHVENLSYFSVASWITLTCVGLPRGGTSTDFFNAAAYYQQVDDAERSRLHNTRVTYKYAHYFHRNYGTGQIPKDHAEAKEFTRPLVVTDPETNTPSIIFAGPHYVGASRKYQGVNLDVSEEIANMVNLPDSNPDLVYSHEWGIGDVLMWPNLRLWHRAGKATGLRKVLSTRAYLDQDFVDQSLTIPPRNRPEIIV